jgi:hypothetical protein
LTREAVRVVIEEVMREELKQFLGAAWGESTPERKGYRNGSYTRDLATRVRVPSKTFKSPEIEKEPFIPRCLIGTAATNQKWLKG